MPNMGYYKVDKSIIIDDETKEKLKNSEVHFRSKLAPKGEWDERKPARIIKKRLNAQEMYERELIFKFLKNHPTMDWYEGAVDIEITFYYRNFNVEKNSSKRVNVGYDFMGKLRRILQVYEGVAYKSMTQIADLKFYRRFAKTQSFEITIKYYE